MALSLLCTFVAHITFLHVFFLPPPFILSLSLLLSPSLSLSFSLSLSLYLCPLFLSVVARHMSSDALYQIFSSWSILLFHTISFTLFTDYLLRLPSSELLEKHLFRSRANRRLVAIGWAQVVSTTEAYWEPFLAWRLHTGFHSTMSSCKARHFWRLYGEHWNFERCILGGWMRMGLQNWVISRLCCILGRWYRMAWLTCVVSSVPSCSGKVRNRDVWDEHFWIWSL